MSVPIWLLDVDGVLNAVSRRPPVGSWPTWSRGRAAGGDGRPFPITFSPDMVAAIRRLHDAGAVELRWLTTWAHDANGELGRLLGMPELPVAGVPPADLLGPRWWKLAHAQAATAEGRPVVWTDDDLAVEAEGADWAGSQPHLLAVAPDPEVGLTPADLAEVEAFVGRQA